MDSIVLFKKYDDGRLDYSGDFTNSTEIKYFILDNYLPRIKRFNQFNLQTAMHNNSTAFVLFAD